MTDHLVNYRQSTGKLMDIIDSLGDIDIAKSLLEYKVDNKEAVLELHYKLCVSEDEVLALHRKLAAAELEANNYKQRYEASNTKYLVKETELMDLKYPTAKSSKFTAQELINKGYKYCKLNNGDTIYLIPLIEKDNVPSDTIVTCIDGTKLLANKMDLDTRGGMLAYGVYPDPPTPPETRTFDNYHERMSK